MLAKDKRQEIKQLPEKSEELAKRCPHCSSEALKKDGKNSSGSQRMMCTDCARRHTEKIDYSDFYISTKSEQCIHSGLDYLRLTAGKHCNPDLVINPDVASYTDLKMQEIWGLFELLNHTNSSHYNIEFLGEKFAVTKKRARQGEALHFSWQDHTIFQFLRPYEGPIRNGMNARGQYWIIDVYGMFFSIAALAVGENTFFKQEILQVFTSLANVKYATRIDFCIDIHGQNVDEVVKRIKHKHKDVCVFKGKDDLIETYYIGKKKSENKYGVVRIYDKKKDIIAKRKQDMYADYMTRSGSITRFEIEIRANFLNEAQFKAEYIFQPQKLMDMFNTYTNSANIQSSVKFDGASQIRRTYRQFQKASKSYWMAQYDKVVERVVMNGGVSGYDLIMHTAEKWGKAYSAAGIDIKLPYTGSKSFIPDWKKDYKFTI